jgi:hypothetical protein
MREAKILLGKTSKDMMFKPSGRGPRPKDSRVSTLRQHGMIEDYNMDSGDVASQRRENNQ